MERPIRTDVVLEEDEILVDAPEEVTLPEDINIEIEPEMDEEGNTIVAFGEAPPEALSDDFYRNFNNFIFRNILFFLGFILLKLFCV